MVVKQDTPAADVENAIRANGGPNLVSVTLFDRYEGAPLEADQVSLAYRLRFQPGAEPMSEAQLEESVAQIGNALNREVGGRIRAG